MYTYACLSLAAASSRAASLIRHEAGVGVHVPGWLGWTVQNCLLVVLLGATGLLQRGMIMTACDH